MALAVRGGWAALRVKWCAAHFTLSAASPQREKRGAPPEQLWIIPPPPNLLPVQPQIVIEVIIGAAVIINIL